MAKATQKYTITVNGITLSGDSMDELLNMAKALDAGSKVVKNQDNLSKTIQTPDGPITITASKRFGVQIDQHKTDRDGKPMNPKGHHPAFWRVAAKLMPEILAMCDKLSPTDETAPTAVADALVAGLVNGAAVQGDEKAF